MTGSAFLTLVAHFWHIRGESELLCNTVNPSLSKIDLRESLSSSSFSLFTCLPTAALLAASPLAAHLSCMQSCSFSVRIFEQKRDCLQSRMEMD